MIDVNEEAARVLDTLPYNVVYQSPEKLAALPAVSYYTLTEGNGFMADNSGVSMVAYIQVDVWSAVPSETAKMAAAVYDVLTAAGWHRDFIRDTAPTDGVYHKTARFCREFIY